MGGGCRKFNDGASSKLNRTLRQAIFSYYSAKKSETVVDRLRRLEQWDDLDLKRLVGRVIARHRASAEVTQEKLAEIAGLERGYISLIERGLRMPTVDTIFRLCRGLKVSPSEVIRDMETQVELELKASKKN